MGSQGRVLVVDDDRAMCEMLEGGLRRRGFDCVWRTSPRDVLQMLEGDSFDVVLTDLNLEGSSGLELCRRVLAVREDLCVVVMTAYGSIEAAVGAIRAGAYDFVTKPFDMDEIALTLERAVQHRQLRAEVRALRDAIKDSQGMGEMIGQSSPMQRVFDLIGRVAETETTVLITGESGTGKELVARALHTQSRRANGPFVAINCAAMPESLLESELFGHVKGAFTDARAARTGLFGKASGGTLFLDEIGEMPMGMQAKLLRALQERRVRPVGGDVEIGFDARIVAATNRDLETEVEEKRFREDLFYRINVVRIAIPGLRARTSDVLLLAQRFVERYASQNHARVAGISSGAAEKLLSYRWPGNVRELQNCIERAVALARTEQVSIEDLPDKVRDFTPSRVIVDTEDPTELLPMDEVERRYILRVLEAVGGSKTMAAKVLGFDRRTLYRKLERYEQESKHKSNGSGSFSVSEQRM
jgi:DNA-binding NtrC family response regulator